MNAIVARDDIRKAVVDSLSNPSEDIARHVLSMAGANPNLIEKSITTGTGLVAYDLQAPAKNLNLGVHGLLAFGAYLALVKARKFGAAADDVMHTRWAAQVGGRAARLAEQMRSGVRQPW